MKKIFLPALALLLLTSLAFSQQQAVQKTDKSLVSDTSVIEKDDCATLPTFPNNDAQYGIQRFPARGGAIDWGLALSGGGIRSAGFSIGVMKVLYDKGYLDDIDVISSVSGGSYASHWLYTNYEPGTRFGKSAFEDNKFIQNVCDLQNADKSNFVTNKLGLQYLVPLKILGLNGKIFDLYQKRISNSFGNGKPLSTKLCFLNSSIKRNIPYFIINTTVAIPKKDRKNEKLKRKSSEVFEITPEFRGNPDLGFREWAGGDDDPLTLSESAAASGLPVFVTKHKINNYEPRLVSGQKLYLSDGGSSENLGALALIRRGVKNIIIVDSEHDPDYKFGAYEKLRKMLKKIDIELIIEAIDNFRENPDLICPTVIPDKGKVKKVFSCSAIAVGRARSYGKIPLGGDSPVDSSIYYLKMSNPKMISFRRFLDEKALTDSRHKGFNIAKKRKWQLKEANEDCNRITFDFENDKNVYADLFTYRVYRYEEFLNDVPLTHPLTWVNVNLMNTVGKVWKDTIYKYPHITTFDQSFFGDQAEAFFGLGYLQAEELIKELDKSKTSGVEKY